MKTFIVTAIALVVFALGGCANMPSDVIGTGAGGIHDPFGLYLPVEPKGLWFSE